MLVVCTAALGTSSCAVSGTQPRRSADPPVAARTRPPVLTTSVLTGTPGVVAAGVTEELFASAPVVVVANANDPAGLAAAATPAERAHAPLLLASPQSGAVSGRRSRARIGVGPMVRAEIRALHPRTVLAVGFAPNMLARQLPNTRVVSDPARLPATGAPAPLRHTVVLIHGGGSGTATIAAATTARAAGAQVVTIRGYDPRADPAAITALSAAKPQHVLALGAGFGSASELRYRVSVAMTGVQLPGGGQVLFPGHRLVALYGHPGTPSLGALGEQGLRASIARARRVARRYRRLSHVPVIPAFEIIATVAEGSPGPDGTYSYETPLAVLRPWVKRATAAGMYVVLDLQAGRASLLTQAKRYEPLLKLPNVGLALDPEWKLQPWQLPLQQIGSVDIRQVNSVVRWLAVLTKRHHLPQKLLVLHQFRLSMIQGERRLDTHHGDLAIVIHMDGQGTPAEKRQTWRAVTRAAPPHVSFGWKNFYTKDHPMLSPRQTMARTPKPVMISYQ
jgi:hypothetical protein